MNSKLITPETETKSRIDKITRLQLDVGSEALIVFFNISTQIENEEFGESFDNGNPVAIPVSQVQKELQSIFEKALELRSQQIEGDSSVAIAPDYKGFYDAIAASQIFATTRKLSTQNLAMNTAFTSFGLALTGALGGHVNLTALQNSLNRVLEVLGELLENEEEIESLTIELRGLIEICNIPLNLEFEIESNNSKTRSE